MFGNASISSLNEFLLFCHMQLLFLDSCRVEASSHDNMLLDVA